MTILEFLQSVLGNSSTNIDFLYYILGGSLLLLVVDGIFSFLFGSISSITRR